MQLFLNFLTILSFIMSAATWLLTAYSRSIRLSCSVSDYRKYDQGVLQLFLYIQNNSEKPMTISGISLIIDNQKYPCELVEKKFVL